MAKQPRRKKKPDDEPDLFGDSAAPDQSAQADPNPAQSAVQPPSTIPAEHMLAMFRQPRQLGILGTVEIPLALGLLRLASESSVGSAGQVGKDDPVRVIHAALDFGLRVFDTADSYCKDEKDKHSGEQLLRDAINTWNGPRDQIRVLTKVGLMRPKGKWLPNGKPDHFRQAVERSLKALGVERIFLLQLHVHDPMVPFEETLACLAELQQAGKVEHLGLCNVSPAECAQASLHFKVATVQHELNVLTRKVADEGLLKYCEQEQIPFMAYRPLGGVAKIARLLKNKTLTAMAPNYQANPIQLALAAVLNMSPNILPIVGATRLSSLMSSIASMTIRLSPADQSKLAEAFPITPSAEAIETLTSLAELKSAHVSTGTTDGSTASAKPSILPANQGPSNTPEIVILMGIQGAGKSHLVEQYVQAGYYRLNRDLIGGKLEDLIPLLKSHLAERSGSARVVLDNTYPTRLSRAPVLAAARSAGIPVRCRYLQTTLPDAHINIAKRMIERYGYPLGPDEMKQFSKTDPNLPPPAAVKRFAASFELPRMNEGFDMIDHVPFVRQYPAGQQKGLLLDVDGTLRITKSGELYPRHPDDVELLPGRREALTRWLADGYKLFFVSNQSGVASGKVSADMVQASFMRTAELLGLPVTEIACCPHPAFPAGCYCRKPMPGLGVYLILKHQLDWKNLTMVGDMDSDAEFAHNLGIKYADAAAFFA